MLLDLPLLKDFDGFLVFSKNSFAFSQILIVSESLTVIYVLPFPVGKTVNVLVALVCHKTDDKIQ